MVWTETGLRRVWRCGPYRVAYEGVNVFAAYLVQMDGHTYLGKRTKLEEAKRLCRRHAERNR